MIIGILQTGHAPDEVKGDLGDYSDMFARLLGGHGFDFATYNVVDGEFPDGPQAADGWLITGSKHGAYEDHPWIAPLEELIRAIRDAGKPLIGVCFGHQIIAQALGGKVEKFTGGWAVGATDYVFEDGTLTLNAWHQDQVTQLPAGAKVLASNAFCANAALAIGDTILTIQPHPEFGAALLDGLITHRAPGVVPADQIASAREKLGTSLDSDRFAQRMAAFFKRTATQ